MWTTMQTPVGPLRLVADGRALTRVEFAPLADDPEGARGERDDDDAVLRQARRELEEYFEGRRRDFDVALAPAGTPFQQRVWAALRTIAWGERASYSEVAARLGMTRRASRAVGLANGRNPLPIVVPCHRVVGADGSLTGYAGGLERKRHLLDLETDPARRPVEQPPPATLF